MNSNIGTAKQNGDYVYVYAENGDLLHSQQGELAGYTSHTVSVRRGDYIYVYSASGDLQFSR
jgi:hypothetical protein